MTDKLVKTIEKMGDNLEVFTQDASKQMQDISDRLGTLEALNDRPQMGRKAEPEGYRIHKGAAGNIYELESKTKMVDVIPPEQRPEIPLGRFPAW